MPFGTQLTTQTLPYVERHIYADWSGVSIGNEGRWQPHIYDFSMPFYGEIMVDLWVQCAWSNPATMLALQVAMLTPISPTNHFVGKKYETEAYGGCFPTPCFGRWANLGAGTFFNLTIDIYTNSVNGTCNIQAFTGFLRAIAY